VNSGMTKGGELFAIGHHGDYATMQCVMIDLMADDVGGHSSRPTWSHRGD